MLSTRSGVHWKVGFERVWERVFGSDSRTSFATVASMGGGGDSGTVVRVARGRRNREVFKFR